LESQNTAGHLPCKFLIVGFGPAGRGAVQSLEHIRERVLVLDLSSAGITGAEAMGYRAELGDASSAEVLEHLHLEQLRMVVITLPSRNDALAAMNQIRSIAPQATIIVRSCNQNCMSEFRNAGADIVVGDEEEVRKALASMVHEQYQRLPVLAVSQDCSYPD